MSSDAIGEGQLASTKQVEERRAPLTLRADGQSGGFKFLGCRREQLAAVIRRWQSVSRCRREKCNWSASKCAL
jgi:hypothetical protein